MSETTNKPSIIFKGILGQKAKATAKQIINSITMGEVDPIYAAVMLKKFSKIHETVHKNTRAKGYIQDAIENHLEGTSKTIKAYGAKITLASKGYWNFENTNDPYLEALEHINKKTEELIKLRKEQMKVKAEAWSKENDPQAIQQFGIRPFMVNWERIPYLDWEEESGEVSTNPPVKFSSEHLRFML